MVGVQGRMQNGGRGVAGLLTVRPKPQTPDNPVGLKLVHCATLVIAAGVDPVNLIESQFGISTTREGFPWNLAGTYVLAMRCVFSVDAQGHQHKFLADYDRTTQKLAKNVFRKGYPWLFHATRMIDFGSSRVDLGITLENQAGRRVFMDFNRNREPVPGDLPFSLDRLDTDVAACLGNWDALPGLPIDRLREMKPLSIKLYLR